MADFALLSESVVAFAKDSVCTLPAELLSTFFLSKLLTTCFRFLYQTHVQLRVLESICFKVTKNVVCRCKARDIDKDIQLCTSADECCFLQERCDQHANLQLVKIGARSFWPKSIMQAQSVELGASWGSSAPALKLPSTMRTAKIRQNA